MADIKAIRERLCRYCYNAEASPRAFPALVALVEKLPPEMRDVVLNGCVAGDFTPLFHAVGGLSPRTIKFLIDAGANPNATDSKGFTALFTSVGDCGNEETTRVLLENGADPNYVEPGDHVSAMLIAATYHRTDALKLLFKYKANPRIPAKDGLVALTAAGDHQETKRLLFDMIKSLDVKEEKKGAGCDFCKNSLDELKRCGKCFSKLYCSRECQVKDWKKIHKTDCKGFVVATTSVPGEDPEKPMYMTNLSNQLRASSPTLDLSVTEPHNMTQEEFRKKVSHHTGKFIVKVQRPLATPLDAMMVYCEDRCITYFLSYEANKEAYSHLWELIATHGAGGLKGYFWAEIHDSEEKAVKIFHTKMAPLQPW